MATVQPGILEPIPPLAAYLFFTLKADASPIEALESLREIADGDRVVVGFGSSLVLKLGAKIEGLRVFQPHVAPGFEVPSTPTALWIWLRGNDRGELIHAARKVEKAVASGFQVAPRIDAFRYGPGLDLTGYEDGTENPKGDEAVAAAVARGGFLDGSSFAAVQQWAHDLDHFESFKEQERDHMIGRRICDNEEIEDAPESAHVKRAAQESFEPEAFIVRRSMPWADPDGEGLVFVAFGKSFDAFEAILKRMIGTEDGVPDALFRFTRPVTGAYFWCPPVLNGRLDLRALGLQLTERSEPRRIPEI